MGAGEAWIGRALRVLDRGQVLGKFACVRVRLCREGGCSKAWDISIFEDTNVLTTTKKRQNPITTTNNQVRQNNCAKG